MNRRDVMLTSTRFPGLKTARSKLAQSIHPSRESGESTCPCASCEMRPLKVSYPTKKVKRGRGRRPSAGAVFDRVAISTRASVPRWADVRSNSSQRLPKLRACSVPSGRSLDLLPERDWGGRSLASRTVDVTRFATQSMLPLLRTPSTRERLTASTLLSRRCRLSAAR